MRPGLLTVRLLNPIYNSDRYGQRIEYLQHILNEPLWNSAANITATTVRARAHLLMMISPYLVREAVPGNSTTSTWVEPMYHHFATTLTSRLPTSLYTYQEKVLHQAVQGTLNEICRTLSLLWVSAVGIEAKSQEEMSSALDSWRGTVTNLMQWLDWPDWVRCDPDCGKDVSCNTSTKTPISNTDRALGIMCTSSMAVLGIRAHRNGSHLPSEEYN